MKATHKDWIVFNGRIVNTKEEQPMIPLEERGFQFGDGIYEVFRLYDEATFIRFTFRTILSFYGRNKINSAVY